MTRRLKAALCLMLTALLLTACSGGVNGPGSEEIIALPEPEAAEVNMIIGEQIASRSVSVPLQYIAGDGTSFSTIYRYFPSQNLTQLCRDVCETLLTGFTSQDSMAFVPTGVKLLDAHCSCGCAVVNLSPEAALIQSDQEYLMVLASITNTLLSIDGIDAVSVQIDNRTRSVEALPVGAVTTPFQGITPAYAQMATEHEYFLTSETGTITRGATLYFPADGVDRFIPEVRQLTFDSDDYASALIRALRSGSSRNACVLNVIPESVDLLVNNPSIEVTQRGERVLRLDFSPTIRNYLTFSGITEWQLLGAVTLTLTSFLPDLDAVIVYIGDKPVTECGVNGRTLVFDGGYIHRSAFDTRIGAVSTLFLPGEQSQLNAVQAAVSENMAYSPLGVLRQLLDRLDGASGADVLGVQASDNIATVNLTGSFYRAAQKLDEAQERACVYAIVNTLCQFRYISGVRFLVEGVQPQTLSTSIYLRSVLLPNPVGVHYDTVEPAETPQAVQN